MKIFQESQTSLYARVKYYQLCEHTELLCYFVEFIFISFPVRQITLASTFTSTLRLITISAYQSIISHIFILLHFQIIFYFRYVTFFSFDFSTAPVYLSTLKLTPFLLSILFSKYFSSHFFFSHIMFFFELSKHISIGCN